MILVDANIFMYAAGSEHPNKAPSLLFLERVAEGRLEAAIDAEVLQEILHRYRSIGRWHDGQRVYSLTRTVISRVLPITAEVMDHARDWMLMNDRLLARDAIHAAAYVHFKAEALCSYDRDFDAIPGISRQPPQAWLGQA